MRRTLVVGMLVGVFALFAAALAWGILPHVAKAAYYTNCDTSSTWSPDPAPWRSSGGQAFTLQVTETFDWHDDNGNPGVPQSVDAGTFSCTTGSKSGDTCTVLAPGSNPFAEIIDGTTQNVCNFNNRNYTSPPNRVDNTAPVCGTWTQYDAQGNITLYDSTDAGGSGINVSGGTCNNVAPGGTCTITISDNAGNTKQCTSGQRPGGEGGNIICTASYSTATHLAVLQAQDNSVVPLNSSTYTWTADKNGLFEPGDTPTGSGISSSFKPMSSAGIYTMTVANADGNKAQCTFRVPLAQCSNVIPQINVSSNLATTWTMYGPNGQTWTETQALTDKSYGPGLPQDPGATYTLVPAAIPGYTVAVQSAPSQYFNYSNSTCSKGVEGSFTIVYTANQIPSSVACTPSSQTADVNTNVFFNASGGNGNFNWTSFGGNPQTGSGSPFRATYASAGNYIATVNDGNSSASCSVQVCAGTPALSILPSSQSVSVGQQATYNAYYSDTCGVSRELAGSEASWSSSNSLIASSNGDGTYNGVNEGSVVVSASYQGLAANASLTVTQAAGADFGCSVIPATIGLYQGESKSGMIQCVPINGFTGTIAFLPSSGVPVNTTFTIAPSSIPVPPNTSSAQYVFAAGMSANPNTFQITIHAKSGGLVHDYPLIVTINELSPALSCSLSASPNPVAQGQPTTFTTTCGGTEIGTLNYSYWAKDCAYRGTSVAAATAACGAPTSKDDASLSTTDSTPWTYTTSGNHTGMVIVERGQSAVQALANVSVTQSTHAECIAGACSQVGGPGVDRCGSTADCGGNGGGGGGGGGGPIHGVCVNNACVNRAGSGGASCGGDVASCGGTGSTHLECQNNACVVVGGAGSNDTGCAKVGDACKSVASGACSLTASPAIVKKGDKSTLSWQCGSGITNCSVVGTTISGGRNGSGPVTPSKTTQYTLQCDGGSTTAKVSVYVVQSYDETNPGGR